MSALNKITVIRGDTKVITVTYTENGSAFDLTNHSVFLTVKLKADQDVTDAEAIITQEFSSGGVSGIATFNLLNADTEEDAAEYEYNVRLVNSDDSVILSTSSGIFEITKGITRRIT